MTRPHVEVHIREMFWVQGRCSGYRGNEGPFLGRLEMLLIDSFLLLLHIK